MLLIFLLLFIFKTYDLDNNCNSNRYLIYVNSAYKSYLKYSDGLYFSNIFLFVLIWIFIRYYLSFFNLSISYFNFYIWYYKWIYFFFITVSYDKLYSHDEHRYLLLDYYYTIDLYVDGVKFFLLLLLLLILIFLF